MAGTFGYELDLGKISEEEKEEIRSQVKEYHRYGELIQKGLYYRLSNPFEDEIGAWAFVSKDQTEVLLNVVMLEIHGNMTNNYVKLKGLKSGCMYQNEETKKVYPADALMDMGLPMPVAFCEYQAYQIHLKMI